MEYRTLGKTGLKVSAIGFGCNRLHDRSLDRRETLATLQQALDRGVNFFDTADRYGDGESERVLCKAIKGRRSKVVLCSKVGGRYGLLQRAKLRLRPLALDLLGRSKGGRSTFQQMRKIYPNTNFDPAYLKRAVERSLRRLGTDHLDLVMAHNPAVDIIKDGTVFETFGRLRERGLIRHYGISVSGRHHICDQEALLALDDAGLSAIQLKINPLFLSPLHSVLPRALEKQVAVILREPLGKGQVLSNPALADVLDGGPLRSKAQTALRFALQIEGPSTVLIGMTKRHHLADNIGTLRTPRLTAAEVAQLMSHSKVAA